MLYTLTAHRHERGEIVKKDLRETYWRLEDAVMAANALWEDEDYLYEGVTINQTVEFCYVTRPPQEAGQ